MSVSSKHIWFIVLILVIGNGCVEGATHVPIASIDLYNPTECSQPIPIEIPVGKIVSPGTIDWQKVKLVCDGNDLPFAIREGKPHYKAGLTTPIVHPRSEDILVLFTDIKPKHWEKILIVEGKTPQGNVLHISDGAF